jgi:hypothetical protein
MEGRKETEETGVKKGRKRKEGRKEERKGKKARKEGWKKDRSKGGDIKKGVHDLAQLFGKVVLAHFQDALHHLELVVKGRHLEGGREAGRKEERKERRQEGRISRQEGRKEGRN